MPDNDPRRYNFVAFDDETHTALEFHTVRTFLGLHNSHDVIDGLKLGQSIIVPYSNLSKLAVPHYTGVTVVYYLIECNERAPIDLEIYSMLTRVI